MEQVWNIIKDHSTPVFMRSVKFKDMDKEQKNEAIRDMTFRIVLFVLLPYILSMVLSFTLAVSSGMFVNEAVTKIIGSYESWRKVRRGIVLLTISTILGASLLLSLSQVVPSIYDFIGYIIGLRWVF